MGSEEKSNSAIIWVALIMAMVCITVAVFVFLFRTPDTPAVRAHLANAEPSAEPPNNAPLANETVKPGASLPPAPLAPSSLATVVAPTPMVARPNVTMPTAEISAASALPAISPGMSPGQITSMLRPYADAGNQKAVCLVANALTTCRIAYDYGVGDSATACADISRNEAAQATGYLSKVAQNGQVDAQMLFIMYPPTATSQLAASEENVKLYLDRAPQYLSAGVSRGNPTALWLAFNEAANPRAPGVPSVAPKSDYYALVYGTVLSSMLAGPIANQVSERLTAVRASAPSSGVDVARALAEANRMREERYNGKAGITAEALNPKKIDCN